MNLVFKDARMLSMALFIKIRVIRSRLWINKGVQSEAPRIKQWWEYGDVINTTIYGNDAMLSPSYF